MKLTSALLATGAVLGTVAFAATAVADSRDGHAPVAPAAAAAEMPPFAVEDFAYPQADKIFEERGIRLIRGDGHIVLADCATATNPLVVSSRSKGEHCFEVTGNGGYLQLELDQVYGVRGNDYSTRVDMSVDEREVSFDVEKNTWTAVGETADPQGRDHVLLEIHANK
ncbi:hypothetical protein QCN29_11840 [Streptomyces sp. HNM0663]|uniref:Secreted protein n=1 Tax=Streptomyces chengmaiensis TaxID=3040919 RepID=A0ABT6HL57_9ACTN|nr:hypothetical protein [Streptomyces chengmaiensis]MDH2389473.1 hypothetical protein [Streptomyces chengmaiensis]